MPIGPVAKLGGGGTLVGGKAPIIGPGAPLVIAEGFPVSCLADEVTPHGEPPHSKATITQSSINVIAMGRGVVRNGDLASCGDPVISASTVIVGG
jgi:uncharacterized Zn-binding protein involved in type VI secretion